MVAKLAEVLVESSLNSERRDVASAEKFLDVQIADYEKRLTLAEQRLADFKKKNIGLMPDERGGYYNRMQSALANIENTRTALQLAKRRQAELSKQLSGEKPLVSSAAYGGPGSLASRLRDYEDQLASLLNRYTDKYPDVQELETRIAALKAGMNAGILVTPNEDGDAGKTQLNPVYQDLKAEWSKAAVEVESLKIQLNEQQRKADELKQYLDTMPDVEAQLARLNRDYEITKSRYLDLVSRRESTQLAQQAGQSTNESMFRIIDPPRVPVVPAGPTTRAVFDRCPCCWQLGRVWGCHWFWYCCVRRLWAPGSSRTSRIARAGFGDPSSEPGSSEKGVVISVAVRYGYSVVLGRLHCRRAITRTPVPRRLRPL